MFIDKEHYDEINRSFPLNAVELLILNKDNKMLMTKRANEPAKGQWWIPGGRILFAESRFDTVRRLLKDECGITTYDIDEIEMFEYAVKNNSDNHYQHTISTVYQIKIVEDDIKMDSQSSEYSWKDPVEWEKLVEHPFLKQLLNEYQTDDPASSFIEGSLSTIERRFIGNELYGMILKSLSIPCVDIFIKNKAGEILLVKRKNDPAKGKWWVPGGRVLYAEKRIDTAKRKLIEECGLEGKGFKKVGNFEFIFNTSPNIVYHDIATLYEVTVDNEKVILDEQGVEYSWKSAADWLKLPLDDFIRDIIENKVSEKNNGRVYN